MSQFTHQHRARFYRKQLAGWKLHSPAWMCSDSEDFTRLCQKTPTWIVDISIWFCSTVVCGTTGTRRRFLPALWGGGLNLVFAGNRELWDLKYLASNLSHGWEYFVCFLGHAVALTLRQAYCLLPAAGLPLALWQNCEQPTVMLKKTIEKPVLDAPPVAAPWAFYFYRQTATGCIPFITRKLEWSKNNISVGVADIKHECIKYNLKSLLVCCHMQHN